MSLKITETKHFAHSSGVGIKIEISNTEESFAWRMEVNGDMSEWTSHYNGILIHKGFAVTTNYWAPEIKEFTPFKIDYAEATN